MSFNLKQFIYDNYGAKVQDIKQNDAFKKAANDLYMQLCDRFGYSWNNDVANAFQHAYISAQFTYQYGEHVSKFLGDYTELTTWSENVNDTNKDLYNNIAGINIAKECILNGFSLNYAAELIFTKIQAGADEFIINPDDSLDKSVMENFSRKNLASETIATAIKAGIQATELINLLNNAMIFSALDNVLSLFNQAQSTQPIKIDPLIIDLNNNGIKTTTTQNGTYFDHQNDGFAEKTAWVACKLSFSQIKIMKYWAA